MYIFNLYISIWGGGSYGQPRSWLCLAVLTEQARPCDGTVLRQGK